MSLIGALIFVLDIVALVSLIAGRGGVSHKVFWVCIILLLPVLGMILYYLCGRSPADA
jgi:hypothetical protein